MFAGYYKETQITHILFIAFGVFVVENLNLKLMLSNAFSLISFRSALAPVIFASFFNNLLYRPSQSTCCQ